MQRVEELGGSVKAIDAGFIQREIEEAAFAFHERAAEQELAESSFGSTTTSRRNELDWDVEILKIDPQTEARTRSSASERLSRKTATASWSRGRLRGPAELLAPLGDGNLLDPLKDALRDHATLGEVCGVARQEFGEY